MGEQAGRGAHLGGHGAQGERAEAALGQHPPDGGRDVAAAGGMVSTGWGHGGYGTYQTFVMYLSRSDCSLGPFPLTRSR
ncbi:hypothetical protein GCM10009738_88060 [Kitasatospora viridis]